jgi:hypothetical protein
VQTLHWVQVTTIGIGQSYKCQLAQLNVKLDDDDFMQTPVKMPQSIRDVVLIIVINLCWTLNLGQSNPSHQTFSKVTQ